MDFRFYPKQTENHIWNPKRHRLPVAPMITVDRSLRPARQSASDVGRPLVCVGIIHREETKTGSAKKMSSSLLTQDVLLFAFAVSIFGKLKPSDSCFSFNHEQSIFDCSWVTHWTYIYLHPFQHNIGRGHLTSMPVTENRSLLFSLCHLELVILENTRLFWLTIFRNNKF